MQDLLQINLNIVIHRLSIYFLSSYYTHIFFKWQNDKCFSKKSKNIRDKRFLEIRAYRIYSIHLKFICSSQKKKKITLMLYLIVKIRMEHGKSSSILSSNRTWCHDMSPLLKLIMRRIQILHNLNILIFQFDFSNFSSKKKISHNK